MGWLPADGAEPHYGRLGTVDVKKDVVNLMSGELGSIAWLLDPFAHPGSPRFIWVFPGLRAALVALGSDLMPIRALPDRTVRWLNQNKNATAGAVSRNSGPRRSWCPAFVRVKRSPIQKCWVGYGHSSQSLG